jgi:hypothetical protein
MVARGAGGGELTAAAGTVWITAADSRLEWDGFPSAPTPAITRPGSRLRLRTDSPSLAVRFTISSPPNKYIYLGIFGQAGLAVYVDDRYLTTVIPTEPTRSPPLNSEVSVFGGQPRRMRSITIYAPLMATCSIEAVGVSSDSQFERPRPYRLDKPVVYYGTSITNGFFAAHGGVTYEAQLGRRLNLDYVVVGNIAKPGDLRMASVLAEVDACAYVLDYTHNMTSVKLLHDTFRTMIETLRSKRPDTPIICITPIYWAGVENPSVPTAQPEDEQEERKREVVRAAVRDCRDKGDKQVFLVEGYDLLGPDQADGITDGGHPNTLGFYWMSQGLEPAMRKILGL